MDDHSPQDPRHDRRFVQRRDADGASVITIGPVGRAIVAAVFTAGLIGVLTAAWHQKENVADHDRDVALLLSGRQTALDSIRAKLIVRDVTDSVRWSQSTENQREILCALQPRRRGC